MTRPGSRRPVRLVVDGDFLRSRRHVAAVRLREVERERPGVLSLERRPPCYVRD